MQSTSLLLRREEGAGRTVLGAPGRAPGFLAFFLGLAGALPGRAMARGAAAVLFLRCRR